MARTPIISGNWKMHLDHFEAISLVQKLAYNLPKADFDNVTVAVHPPFTDLRSIQTLIGVEKLAFELGAQNVHWEPKGAFTGEISPQMLAKLNVHYVIVGHSERRQMFGDTDEHVLHKTKAVLDAGMTPIVCCGETFEEREAGITNERVAGQIRAALAGLSSEAIGALVVAYEPIWAIGTGRTATAEDAQTVCAHLRSVIGELAGAAVADAVRIQYGGSAKAANAAELLGQADIDGLLVGGASLDADEFAAIVRAGQA